MNYASNYVVVLMCATLGPLLVGVLLIFEIWSMSQTQSHLRDGWMDGGREGGREGESDKRPALTM